jgi:hypothetical protein
LSRLLQVAYQLRTHELGDRALDRWAAVLTLGGAAVILLRWWFRGMPSLPAWHWAVLALLLLGGVALLWLAEWAARRMYIVFEPDSAAAPPDGKTLAPDDKVLTHVTARFEVAGKTHFFAGLLAYWRTFATREHAVMAIVHESRFLLVGRMPEQDVGMWYVFFRPERVESVSVGKLTFGANRRPALRVVHCGVPPAPSGRPNRGIVYLAFDDESARASVWADLLVDGF